MTEISWVQIVSSVVSKTQLTKLCIVTDVTAHIIILAPNHHSLACQRASGSAIGARNSIFHYDLPMVHSPYHTLMSYLLEYAHSVKQANALVTQQFVHVANAHTITPVRSHHI